MRFICYRKVFAVQTPRGDHDPSMDQAIVRHWFNPNGDVHYSGGVAGISERGGQASAIAKITEETAHFLHAKICPSHGE
jgi:hypothetical protein